MPGSAYNLCVHRRELTCPDKSEQLLPFFPRLGGEQDINSLGKWPLALTNIHSDSLSVFSSLVGITLFIHDELFSQHLGG